MPKQGPVPLRSTLGFFAQGIPVVFIKSRAVFRSGDSADDYLRLLDEWGAAMPGEHFGDDAVQAFETFGTVFHEIRHFHDALLCRPLFENFLRQHKITWYVLQLLIRFAELRQLPADQSDPLWISDQRLKTFRQLILDADEDSFVRYPDVDAEGDIDGQSVMLLHLLEASAVTMELLHLYAVHGIGPMESYYQQVVLRADEVYNLLLKKFEALYGDIVRGIPALYTALGISLTSSNAPVTTFCALYAELQAAPQSIWAKADDWLADPFPDEDVFAKAVLSEQLVYQDTGQPIQNIQRFSSTFPAEELTRFHHVLYLARRALIETYVKQFRYVATEYFGHLHELPVPPVLFYPVDADSQATIVPAIRESDLNERGVQYFVIAASEQDGQKIVIAGLRSVAGTQPCISLGICDLILFTNFCYRHLFQGLTHLYSRGIDDMYMKLLREFVLGSASTPD